MTIVNITQVALLSGKDRNTIQRYIKKGVIIKKGQGVDTEDLIALFGELKQVPKPATLGLSEFKGKDQRELILLNYAETLQQRVNELSVEKNTLVDLLERRLDNMDKNILEVLNILNDRLK